MITLLFLAVVFLAYSNGANDNFKGVASLFGSQTANYRYSQVQQPKPRSRHVRVGR